MFVPSLVIDSVLDLDDEKLNKLKERGINTLFFDLDNTLTTWNNMNFDESILNWFHSLKGKGFNTCIISNNHYPRIAPIAEVFETEFVVDAFKPFTKGYKEGLKKFNVEKSQAMMIGDQIYTDIFGANNTGIYSCLVTPIDTSREFKMTKLNRKMESIFKPGILKKYEKKGGII